MGLILLILVIGTILAIIEGIWWAVFLQIVIGVILSYYQYKYEQKQNSSSLKSSNAHYSGINDKEHQDPFMFKVQGILIGKHEREIARFTCNSADEVTQKIGEFVKQYGFYIKSDGSNVFETFPIEFIVTTRNGVTVINNLTVLYAFYRGYSE